MEDTNTPLFIPITTDNGPDNKLITDKPIEYFFPFFDVYVHFVLKLIGLGKGIKFVIRKGEK